MRPTATPHCGRRNVEPGARGSGNEIVSDAVATLPAGMVGAGAGAAVTAFATGGEAGDAPEPPPPHPAKTAAATAIAADALARIIEFLSRR